MATNNKNYAIPVREFLRPSGLNGAILSATELNQKLKTNHYVKYDDGILYQTAKEIIFNRYIWEIFIKCDKVPIMMKHSISTHYVNGFFTSGGLTNLITEIFKDVVDVYVRENEDRSILNDYLYEAFGDVYNNIYNEMVCTAYEYINTIDLIDILEIQFKPEILKALKEVKQDKSKEAVDRAYDTVKKIIYNDPSLANNSLAKGYIAGTFNSKQVNTLVGPVGHVADIDKSIYPVPIFSSYSLGLRDFYEQAIAGRLAAGSIFTSTSAIKDSEYNSRLTQLVAMRVEHLVDGDCGSTEYLEVELDHNTGLGKSELPLWVGKRYVCPETGELKIFKATDTHLRYEVLGKPVKFRTPLYCKHKHSSTVCVVCLGDISYSIPYDSNLGHTCAARTGHIISQGTLSDKHHQDSASGIDCPLADNVIHFVKEGNQLYFNKKRFYPNKCDYQLLVPHDSLKGLVGLKDVDLNKINISKISSLEEVHILETDKKTGSFTPYPIYLAYSKKGSNDKKEVSKKVYSSKIYGHLSANFLKYIINSVNGESRYQLRTNSSGTEDNDYYYISLNDWLLDKELCKESVIEYPAIKYSLSVLIDELESNINKPGASVTSDMFLESLHKIINSKLNVNIGLLEVIALSFTVTDLAKRDIRVCKEKGALVAGVKTILLNGSNAGFYGYENHKTSMDGANTFNGMNYYDHPLDALVCPKEVMEDVMAGRRR